MCRFASFMVPVASATGYGTARAMTRCEEHNWDFDGPVSGNLCPIGRIDKAVEDGLARLAARS